MPDNQNSGRENQNKKEQNSLKKINKAAKSLMAATVLGAVLIFSLILTPKPKSVQGAGVVRMQSASKTGTSGSTLNLAFPSANTAGNLLVVVAETDNGANITVSDSKGNAYTLVRTVTWNYGLRRLSLFYASNIAAGSNSVTLTAAQGGGGKQLQIFEYSGIVAVSPLDQSSFGTSLGSGGLSITSPNIAITQADALLFSAGGPPNNVNNNNITVGSGYTKLLATNNGAGTSIIVSQDRVVSALGSYNASLTWTPGQPSGGIILAAFKAAPVGPDIQAPSIPSNLTATGTSVSQINLSWTASADNVGVSGYKVFRNSLQVATTTVTSFSDTGLIPNTSYTYAVAAFDAAGNVSALSSSAVGTTHAPDVTAPNANITAPANNATVFGTTLVSASASDNVGVAGVQFVLDGTNLQSEDTSAPYQISWNTNTASEGSHALFAVARDAAGNIATSAPVNVVVDNIDQIPPSTPTNLSANAVSQSQINLSWTASTDNVQVLGYKIFRDFAQVGTTTLTSYNDSGLTASTQYTYTVSAFDISANNSGQSSPAVATTLDPDLTAPVITLVNSTNITSSAATITWATDELADTQVEYGLTTSYGQQTTLNPSQVTNHSASISGLTSGTLYHYRVKSRDASGNLAVSGDFTFTTQANVGLVGYWKFDEGSGSVAVDSSGNGNNGSISNAAYVTGKIGSGALSFNGSNSVVTVPASNSLSLNSPYTIAAWVKLASGNGSYQIIASRAQYSNRLMVVSNWGGGVVSEFGSSLSTNLGVLSSGVWHHMVYVGGSTGQSIYINGVLVISDSFSGANFNTTNPIQFGSYNGGYPLNGSLDEIRIYNRALSASEVVDVFNDQGGPVPTPTPTPIPTPTPLPDTTSPTMPANLSAVPVSSAQINIFWASSTDPVIMGQITSGIAGYRVFRDGNQVGTTTLTAFSDIGLNASTTYAYTVDAFDAAGNFSVSSSQVNATTLSNNPPTGAGWQELANTKVRTVCPPANFGGMNYDFLYNCRSIVNWSGGIADTLRNRLVVWGGGHGDYYGNELYALNLGTTTSTLTRISDPSPINSNPQNCPTTLADGKPNSRHTYNGLAYIAHADRMLAFSGSLACSNGSHFDDLWTLNLSTLQWQRMDPVNGAPGQQPTDFYTPVEVRATYDPNSHLVFISNGQQLWSYDYDTNTYNYLSANAFVPYNATPVIDPVNKLLIFMGNENQSPVGSTGPARVKVISIAPGSSYAIQDWSGQVTGCNALAGAYNPGLAYDSSIGKIVGWPNFGNSVYVFDPIAKSCTSQTFANGPKDSVDYMGNKFTSGTFGRFQYFPALNAYGLVNDVDNNAYKFAF